MNGGHAREAGELVDHPFELSDLTDDGFRPLLDRFAGIRIVIAKLACDALGGELDRRERVLDLVRDAARGFIPCGELLRLHELRRVFECEHPACAAAEARDGEL